MYAEYKRFMQEYIELGHMQEVNNYQELEQNKRIISHIMQCEMKQVPLLNLE